MPVSSLFVMVIFVVDDLFSLVVAAFWANGVGINQSAAMLASGFASDR